MIKIYEERTYRKLFNAENLIYFNVCVLETDLTIGAHKNLEKEALEVVLTLRNELLEYIKLQPGFLTSLEPIEILGNAPMIAKQMGIAAKKTGVGPMAAVAGAFSELVGRKLLEYSDEIIVENGGDIFLKANSTKKIGIYAGDSQFSNKIGLEVLSASTPIGICTSSGTVGHSLSFGKADAAVILSKDTFLADAVATATGNIVKSADDIEKAINFAMGIEGIEGAVIIVGDKIGASGDIKLVML